MMGALIGLPVNDGFVLIGKALGEENAPPDLIPSRRDFS